MIRVVEMTYQEKYEMFMKLDKEEVVKMLIENNRLLDIFVKPGIGIGVSTDEYLELTNQTKSNECPFYIAGWDTAMNCQNCGKPESEH